jgi:myotubularin-related protein 6/7/8
MDTIKVAKVDNVILERYQVTATVPTKYRQSGTIHLTPHHLIFSPSQAGTSARATSNELWISYPTITLLTRLPQAISGLYPLQIRTRTFDSWVLLFDKERDGGAEDVWQSVKDSAVICEYESDHFSPYQLQSSSSMLSSILYRRYPPP